MSISLTCHTHTTPSSPLESPIRSSEDVVNSPHVVIRTLPLQPTTIKVLSLLSKDKKSLKVVRELKKVEITQLFMCVPHVKL